MTDLALSARPVRRYAILPGLPVTLGITLVYLALMVLIPLAGLFIEAGGGGLHQMVGLVTSPRSLAAFRVSFGIAAAAALTNAGLGLVAAWALERYDFPGRRLLDALVDLPFALPTAVAGIALAALYADNGWIGALLAPYGIQIAFTRLGIFVALLFTGLPYVIRAVQPVLADLGRDVEEASLTLGATGWQTFRHVIAPPLVAPLLTGIALAFARGVGEYGSIIFIAGNMPGVSEIVPLLIVVHLEQFDYAGASVLAAAMLIASFVVLLALNLLQARRRARHAR